MRGLKAMLDGEPGKNRTTKISEEAELVKEPWYDDPQIRRGNLTEEEMIKYKEYEKKQKEIQERKEKKRAQNLTKLTNARQDIEADKIILETK